MKIKVVLLITYFISCSTTSSLINQLNVDNVPLVIMTRTACYGTCPQYTISIYDNGLIKYDGKLFVDKKGCFYSKISKSFIDRLNTKITTINFFDLNTNYDAPMTDLPSVIVEVNLASNYHKITDRFSGPEKLKELQLFIDSISNSVIEWQLCN